MITSYWAAWIFAFALPTYIIGILFFRFAPRRWLLNDKCLKTKNKYSMPFHGLGYYVPPRSVMNSVGIVVSNMMIISISAVVIVLIDDSLGERRMW